MHLDDRMLIETPEGVSIEVTLAGLGSRLGATVIDLLIQGGLLLALTLAFSLSGTTVSQELNVFLLGLGTVLVAVVVVGYYVVFEAFNGGRTPGKAALGIGVATVDGTPLGLGAVTLRTLMRLVDFLPAAYVVGALSIAVTARNQRLGDLVANTVVIRHRMAKPAPAGFDHAAQPQSRRWDVSGIGPAEVALVRRFLARRSSLTPEAQARLTSDLATKLRPRVPAGRELSDLDFLRQVVAEKDDR